MTVDIDVIGVVGVIIVAVAAPAMATVPVAPVELDSSGAAEAKNRWISRIKASAAPTKGA